MTRREDQITSDPEVGGEVSVALDVSGFVKRCPLVVHYAPRGQLRVGEGLLTARQIVESCKSSDGTVCARYLSEREWHAVDARTLVERSRFLKRAGEIGSNVLVKSADAQRTYLLGNNYPLGDGSCIGTTIPLTDNRDGDAPPTREEWFRILNSMFWVFDANHVNPGFVRHARDAAGGHGLSAVKILTERMPSELLERIRLSAINGGGSNGAPPRGTATYKRLEEWTRPWPPKEIAFEGGVQAGHVEAMMRAGTLRIEDF